MIFLYLEIFFCFQVYVAEAILFKRLEMSSTTEETEKLSIALTRLSEVEKKLNLRIIDHVSALPEIIARYLIVSRKKFEKISMELFGNYRIVEGD